MSPVTIRAIFFALTTSALCVSPNASSNELPEDANEAVAFLTKRIPAGTPLSTAQREMESLGFSCGLGYGQSYPGATSVGTFLYCSRKLSSGPVIKLWQVAILDEGGKVSSVHVTYGVIGP